MKKIFSIVFLCLFLVSCGEESVVSEGKKEFFIETKMGNEFSGNFSLQKTGKIRSSQDILLTSNAQGRVLSIFVKAGDKVQASQPLAILEDNIGNYNLNVERAQNALQRANLSYETAKIQGEKGIKDIEVQIDTLQKNLENFEKNATQTIIQAKNTIDNSNYSQTGSTSSLQIQQLDASIAKSQLDYENKKIADTQTLASYEATLQTQMNALVVLLHDVTELSDSLFGVSIAYRNKNDDFEDLFGARDSSQKRETKTELETLLQIREGEEISQIQKRFLSSDSLSDQEISTTLQFIEENFERIKTHLNNVEQTLSNSIQSVGQLSSSDVASFQLKIDTLQASSQANYAAFISFSSGVRSFLSTYKNSQDSILKSIDLQKQERDILYKNLESGDVSANVGYEKTLISLDESRLSLTTQLDTAKRNLTSAIQNYDLNLKSLENAIKEAEISYKSAVKELSKLTITSPINGTISEVFIDKGQELSQGKQVFNILSDDTPEVEIAFSQKEKELVSLGQNVYIQAGNEKISGKIYSLSDVADSSLNYSATIVFTSGIKLIGEIAQVEIPVDTGKMLVPVNSITTQSEGNALVYTLSGETLAPVRVRLGEVYGQYAEVLSCAKDCESLKIILSDISNFDPNLFILSEKK